MSEKQWRVDERKARGSVTLWAPIWPHGGEPGDARYVRCSPARGWQILRAEASGESELYDATYAGALAAVPDEMEALVRQAHALVEAKCRAEVEKWRARRSKLIREQLDEEHAPSLSA